jgi:hypothetical protein
MPNQKRTAVDLPWQIEMIPLRNLKPSPRNARTHSKKQINQIAGSMLRFGVINPVVADGDGNIVAGAGRWAAAKQLGFKTIPVIRLTDMSETEIRAYATADNKIALNAGWDRELLAVELQELQVELPKIDLDLDITGFDPGEVDGLLEDLKQQTAYPADQIPERIATITARRGDTFVLGHHRLGVGDARNPDVYRLLMGSERAEMAFLDPPYNVRIDGHAGGRGRTKHREFALASGEMSSESDSKRGHDVKLLRGGGTVGECLQ